MKKEILFPTSDSINPILTINYLGAENVAKIGVWERKMWHWGAENVQKSL